MLIALVFAEGMQGKDGRVGGRVVLGCSGKREILFAFPNWLPQLFWG
jgi:hypothetical protein